MPRVDEKAVRKYLKVLALAQGSSGGEQASAARVLASMEKKHPGIRRQAEKIRRAEQNGQVGKAQGPQSWQDFFSFLGDVYTGVSGAVRAAMSGVRLAKSVRFSRTTRVGGTYVSARIPTRTIMELRELDEAQLDVFRAELIQAFDAQIQDLLD